ncbi:hypothetical protein CAPTEDRAFT_213608 [Capitella teleta]|uniref:Hint domain-containing protein n=1 Tax=Capitella teleta TaxID=283909 RepID=R7VK16_CAPTE|nr:hypothetical protein CAPTEDRAFT_213608 [Capitella teleta]|eukprot:ELU16390.1 hypothetical protein CAPTEDRAFT_213608 [Capitella teleta]
MSCLFNLHFLHNLNLYVVVLDDADEDDIRMTMQDIAMELQENLHGRKFYEGLTEFEALEELAKIRQMRTHNPKCPCYCRQVGGLGYKCCECDITETTCFPAEATVKRLNGDVITMKDLQIGDKIMTVNDGGTPMPTEVISFLHYEPDVTGVYTQVTTELGNVISLSGSHLIYASSCNQSNNRQPRYSSTLKVGEHIFTSQDSPLQSEKIVRIRTRLEKGAYVPLTESGTLLVDDALVSCYASFDHDIAHLAMTPLRWFPWLLNGSQYIQGVLPYVYYMKLLGRTLLPSTTMRPSTSTFSPVLPATNLPTNTSLLAVVSFST